MGKIILDCDLMKHPHSGLYHYCLNLGNHVSKLLKSGSSGHRMYYYVPPAETGSFHDPSFSIPERRKWHKLVRPFLWDCDIWHAPFQSGRIFPSKGSGTKIVLTIHDLNCIHEGKPAEEIRKSLAHTQQLIDRADAIVCISSFCKQDVIDHCELGTKPVHVIHNGTHQLAEPALGTGSYRPRAPFLFGMGYVNRKKNFHVLLPLLQESNYELIIAGKLDEPDYIAHMKSQAMKMGVSDRLHILGPVSEQEKSWYMSECLAYLHPSLAEGFGAPVVEAMTFGKPVFLSSLTSLPEIGGDVSFYFRHFSADHMRTVLLEGLNKFKQNGLSDAIRNRASQFNWETRAEQYLTVYESLL